MVGEPIRLTKVQMVRGSIVMVHFLVYSGGTMGIAHVILRLTNNWFPKIGKTHSSDCPNL